MRQVATIAVMNGSKMLMGRRRDSQKWTHPGGHLNEGETPEAGALRELKEETGIEGVSLRPLGAKEVDRPKGKIKVHAFRCDYSGPTTMRHDPDQEVEKWGWIDTSDGAIPEHAAGSLHSPENVLLDLMGMKYKIEKTAGAGHGGVGASSALVGGAALLGKAEALLEKLRALKKADEPEEKRMSRLDSLHYMANHHPDEVPSMMHRFDDKPYFDLHGGERHAAIMQDLRKNPPTPEEAEAATNLIGMGLGRGRRNSNSAEWDDALRANAVKEPWMDEKNLAHLIQPTRDGGLSPEFFDHFKKWSEHHNKPIPEEVLQKMKEHFEAKGNENLHEDYGPYLKFLTERPEATEKHLPRLPLSESGLMENSHAQHAPPEALASFMQKFPKQAEKSLGKDMPDHRVLRAALDVPALKAKAMEAVKTQTLANPGTSIVRAMEDHPEAIQTMFDTILKHGTPDDNKAMFSYLMESKHLTPEQLRQVVQDPKQDEEVSRALQHPNADASVVDAAIKRRQGDTPDIGAPELHPILRSPGTNESHIKQLLDDPKVMDNPNHRELLYGHHLLPRDRMDSIIQELRNKNPHGIDEFVENQSHRMTPEQIQELMASGETDDTSKSPLKTSHYKKLLANQPDETFQKLLPLVPPHVTDRSDFNDFLMQHGFAEDPDQVEFPMDAAKLRQARDMASGPGGSIHKKELEKANLKPSDLKIAHLQDAKGNIKAADIQKHIDSLPKMKFGHTDDEYGDAFDPDAGDADPTDSDYDQAREDVEQDYPLSEYLSDNPGDVEPEHIKNYDEKLDEHLINDHDWTAENPDYDEKLEEGAKRAQELAQAHEEDDHPALPGMEKKPFLHHAELSAALKQEGIDHPKLHEGIENMSDAEGMVGSGDIDEWHEKENPKEINYLNHDTHSMPDHPDYDDRASDAHNKIVSNLDLGSRNNSLTPKGFDRLYDNYSEHINDKVNDRASELASERGGGDDSRWLDKQQHSHEPSQVFQLNYTKDHANQMKKAGVWEPFQKFMKDYSYSAHPVKANSIGWVRYTKKPDGTFIDEIQSDFGQNLVKQISKQAKARVESGQMTPSEAARAEATAKEKWGDVDAAMPKITQILFQGKHPNDVLHEAFHQHLRNKGETGKPVHIWRAEGKAPISNLSEGKDLPGHFQRTYTQTPEKLGYKPAKYGELATQTTESLKGEPTQAMVLKKMEALRARFRATRKIP